MNCTYCCLWKRKTDIRYDRRGKKKVERFTPPQPLHTHTHRCTSKQTRSCSTHLEPAPSPAASLSSLTASSSRPFSATPHSSVLVGLCRRPAETAVSLVDVPRQPLATPSRPTQPPSFDSAGGIGIHQTEHLDIMICSVVRWQLGIGNCGTSLRTERSCERLKTRRYL